MEWLGVVWSDLIEIEPLDYLFNFIQPCDMECDAFLFSYINVVESCCISLFLFV